jgi:hypothetical protein
LCLVDSIEIEFFECCDYLVQTNEVRVEILIGVSNANDFVIVPEPELVDHLVLLGIDYTDVDDAYVVVVAVVVVAVVGSVEESYSVVAAAADEGVNSPVDADVVTAVIAASAAVVD